MIKSFKRSELQRHLAPTKGGASGAGEADVPPFRAAVQTARRSTKPGGAEGAALFAVLIFPPAASLIGPRSGPSAEISPPVISYNSPPPPPAAAGCISITSETKTAQLLLDHHIRMLSRSVISTAVPSERRRVVRAASQQFVARDAAEETLLHVKDSL